MSGTNDAAVNVIKAAPRMIQRVSILVDSIRMMVNAAISTVTGPVKAFIPSGTAAAQQKPGTRQDDCLERRFHSRMLGLTRGKSQHREHEKRRRNHGQPTSYGSENATGEVTDAHHVETHRPGGTAGNNNSLIELLVSERLAVHDQFIAYDGKRG